MKVPMFTLSSVLVKISQIPHVIFQTTSQFFLKFCVMLYTLQERNQSKCKFLRLLSPRIKIHQILVIFWNNGSVFLQILHHSSVPWHVTRLYFLAKILYTFNKRSLSKYKFGEISPEQSKVWNFALWWVTFVKIT